MFIFSLKVCKKRIYIYIALIGLLVMSMLCFLFFQKDNDKQAICSNGKYNLCVKNNNERLEFLSQFGWEVLSEPTEITTITIPAKFNSTYDKYNDIQKEQGLDLKKYQEKSCTRYTYQILNYKDSSQGVRANLLVFDNKVIGGDISSMTLNGFIHGFFDPNKANV